MQASIEFFILFVLLLFIFTFLVGLIGSLSDLFTSMAARDRARGAAFEVAQAVNSALISGNGSRTTVIVPLDFNISYQARVIEAKDFLNRSGYAAVLTDNVSILSSSGNLSVSNINGTVVISG